MLLAIDIGNTTISLGLFGHDRLLKKYSIPTGDTARSASTLKKIFSRDRIEDVVFCSVVPWASTILTKDVARLLHKKPLCIGKDLRVPIKNLYRRPAQVGQDRLVNGYAALKLYGCPTVIIDFGTTVTFDVISRQKEYLGGMILPGLAISLDALAQRTALLPKIKLDKPKEFIGKDTQSSMLSGIVFGFAALTDDLTKRIKHQIGNNAKIIGTGGNIPLIAGFCKSLQVIDQDLTLKGIHLIYKSA